MSKINLYFNKNTKKLEETVFLKKNIIIPKFSFPKKRRFSSPISRLQDQVNIILMFH